MESRLKYLPLVITFIYLGYAGTSVLVLLYYPLERQSLLSGVLLAFATPFLIMSRPFHGPLEAMGMMSGEWWRMPTPVGVMLVTTVYGVAIYAVASVFVHFIFDRRNVRRVNHL